MFKNYLTTALRSIRRDKLFSVINIAGLAIGLTASMLIILYIKHENSFDLFHKNADRMFWIRTKVRVSGDSLFMPRLPYTAAPIVAKKEPSVESFLRIRKAMENAIIQNPSRPSLKFAEPAFAFADSNFFNFFSFKLLRGNSSQVLQNPLSVVVSEEAALKYFGTTDVIGKTLVYNNAYDLTITGVAENAPSNSSIRYDFVASLSSMSAIAELGELVKKDRNDFMTFFTLTSKDAIAKIEYALATLNKETEKDKFSSRFIGVPMRDFRADSGEDNNTAKYLKLFSFVAGVILLLAMINYINLTTARAALRAKEVGIRKVMGAGRGTLGLQFFAESFLCIGIAFVFGYGLCMLLQTWFFGILNINIDHSFIRQPELIISFGILFLMITLLSSIYPSLLLSAFKPATTLYGKFLNKGNGRLRRFFTVFQFAIAIIFILCAIIIHRQIHYVKTADTGIDRDNVLTIPFGNDLARHSVAFKQGVNAISGIQKTALALHPLFGGYDMIGVTPQKTGKMILMPVLNVDQEFVSILRLQWKQPPADPLFFKNKQNVLLNEAAAAQFNLGKTPLNQQIDQFVVSGVLKDFNWKSLEYRIQPLLITVTQDVDSNALWSGGNAKWSGSSGCLFVKISAGANIPLVLDQIKQLYQQYERDAPFEYHFMDAAYDAQYKAEERLAIVLSGFATLASIIAGMGLFGLIAFLTTQRVKEIGVRKVLGASVGNIVALLSGDFVKLVLLSILIAAPVGWYCMHHWLENFVYHVKIEWWVIVLSGMGAVLIALVTIASQAIRAARANPVEALRSE